ncbi:MAG: cytidine deaminase [Bdellovibrionales bacterium CG10_big_fil_rev_8_21_14_0_10_45_34]|nr:MAG: cytidine deaminase [Bdellovibrionales bacterium CG10_big_fil_rev_8_21_14_0_10_45_34]
MALTIEQMAYELAKNCIENSYSPYSKFRVAAVVKFTSREDLYAGVNVENASGIGCCAERSAIASAISHKGAGEIEFCLIVAEPEEAIPPCGVCRQVLSEFAGSHTQITLANTKRILKRLSFSDLYPNPFDRRSLTQGKN